MVPDLFWAPDFYGPQEIWAQRMLGPQNVGSCIKMPYNDFHAGPKFLGPKFLGDHVQISKITI